MTEEELAALEKTAVNDLEDYYGGWYAEQIGKLCVEVRRMRDILSRWKKFRLDGFTYSGEEWYQLAEDTRQALSNCQSSEPTE